MCCTIFSQHQTSKSSQLHHSLNRSLVWSWYSWHSTPYCRHRHRSFFIFSVYLCASNFFPFTFTFCLLLCVACESCRTPSMPMVPPTILKWVNTPGAEHGDHHLTPVAPFHPRVVSHSILYHHHSLAPELLPICTTWTTRTLTYGWLTKLNNRIHSRVIL